MTVAAGVSAARSFLTCRLKFSRDASAVVGSGESRSFSMREQRWVWTEPPESPAERGGDRRTAEELRIVAHRTRRSVRWSYFQKKESSIF